MERVRLSGWGESRSGTGGAAAETPVDGAEGGWGSGADVGVGGCAREGAGGGLGLSVRLCIECGGDCGGEVSGSGMRGEGIGKAGACGGGGSTGWWELAGSRIVGD